VLNDLQSFAKKQGAIFLKMDPDVVLGRGVPSSEEDIADRDGQVMISELKHRGWEYSSDQIQFKNTILLDLTQSEEEMLRRMKQKTRYNIRLAERKDVVVRVGILDDLSMLYRMYAETSVRDGFVIRDEGYYKAVWQTFLAKPLSQVSSLPSPIADDQVSRNIPMAPFTEPLIAEVDHEPVSLYFTLQAEPITSTACRAILIVKKCQLICCNGKRSGAPRQRVARSTICGEHPTYLIKAIRCGACIDSRKAGVDRFCVPSAHGTSRPIHFGIRYILKLSRAC
jgi:hypothetical protein